MKKCRKSIGRGEKSAAGESKRQDGWEHGLQAKVDGERLGLNGREDGSLGSFEQNRAVDKSLETLSDSLIQNSSTIMQAYVEK